MIDPINCPPAYKVNTDPFVTPTGAVKVTIVLLVVIVFADKLVGGAVAVVRVSADDVDDPVALVAIIEIE